MRVANLVAQVAVFFFLTPFIISSLGDHIYGLWTLVATIVGYYGMLDLGLSAAITRFMAVALGKSDKQESDRLLTIALVCFTGLGLVVFVMGLGLALASGFLWEDAGDRAHFQLVVLILSLHLALDFPVRAYAGVVTAQSRFDILSLLQILSLTLRTLLIVFLLSRGHTIVGLAMATLLSAIPEKLLLVYIAKRTPPFLRFHGALWSTARAKELLSYSGYALVAQLGDVLRFSLDSVVVAAFLTVAAVTHYRVAGMMVQHFSMVVIAVVGVLLPTFSRLWARAQTDQLMRTLFLSTKLSIFLSSFVAFGFLAWGRPFIIKWLGEAYVDAYPVLVVLTIASMFDLWQTPTVGLLYGMSQHKFYAIFNTVEGLANLVLSVALVGRFGMMGVALGTLLPATVVRLVVQPLYLSRVTPIAYPSYLRLVARTVGVAALALAFPLVLTIQFAEPNYRTLLVLGTVSAALFIFAAGWLGFDVAERRLILGAIRPRRPEERTK